MRILPLVFVIMTVIASCRYVLFMFSLFVCSVWSYILSECHSVLYVCPALMTDKLIVFILTIVQIQRNCTKLSICCSSISSCCMQSLNIEGTTTYSIWALRLSRYCSKRLSNSGYPEKDNIAGMSFKCEYFDLL